MNRQQIISAFIIISMIIFFSLLFLSSPPKSSRPVELPSTISIITDENISIWQNKVCTEPLEISLGEISSKKKDTIFFYVRNDQEYDVVVTWEDNIYGDSLSSMKFFKENDGTWWLWPEYVSEGINYGIVIKSGQVLKVRYELGPLKPLRFTFYSMKSTENEE